MEPISLIVAALVAGLTADATEYTRPTALDGYQAFRARLWAKVEASEEAKVTFIALEKKPDSEGRQHSMKTELVNLGVEKDGELIHLAQTLLQQLDQKGTQSGKYLVNTEDR